MTAQTVAALLTSLLVVAAAVAFDVHCLRDLANAEFVYRLPPRTWACLIVVFTPLGGMAYLTLGRLPPRRPAA